ncbi:MAG: hypothetical protein HYU36_18555 [Planctomycetes bacterium]|nr:hypothetical protein [Planctomycetota bacterium]
MIPERPGRSVHRGLVGPCSWVLLIWTGSVAQPANPFTAPPARPQGRPCILFLSTGERLHGLLATTRGNPLRFLEESSGNTQEWTLDQVREIRIEAAEDVVPEWRWKESGSDEKISTGFHYRHADFRVTVVLETGERFTGRWRTGLPILLEIDDQTVRKFILRPEVKDISNKRSDPAQLPPLAYVSRIVFDSGKEAPP